MELIPQAREILEHAEQGGRAEPARAAAKVIDDILARPEHAWFEQGAADQAQIIRKAMEKRYGEGAE